MKSQLFIPKKCKVGFNERNDTYTGLLGYIIAWDGKKWRKENSWEGWREKYITADEFEEKKKKAFEYARENAIKNHKSYIEYYNNNPTGNAYYKQYAEMTIEQFFKEQRCDDYSTYYFNNGKEKNNPKLEVVEFENIPTSGFVLNKKAGGYNTGWNHRSTYCRVWDPRGWEFEISIPNLLYILQESSSFKGKGLDGEFIYSWDGKDLVLLPCCSSEYTQSEEFTKLQNIKFSAKNLQAGHFYQTKNQDTVTYLGKYEDYSDINVDISKKPSFSKFHIFEKNGQFLKLYIDKISNVISKDDKFSDKLENFLKLNENSKTKCFVESPIVIGDGGYIYKKNGDLYDLYYYTKNNIWNSKYYQIRRYHYSFSIENNRLISYHEYNRYRYDDFISIDSNDLQKNYVNLNIEMCNGKILKIKNY